MPILGFSSISASRLRASAKPSSESEKNAGNDASMRAASVARCRSGSSNASFSIFASAVMSTYYRTLRSWTISFWPNAKLTHGSLKPAGGSTTGQGEGAEAAEAASVTEPVDLWPHFYNNPRGETLGAAYGSVCLLISFEVVNVN